jgi:hypothetical protein
MIGFVDDSNGQVNIFSEGDSSKTLSRKGQSAAQRSRMGKPTWRNWWRARIVKMLVSFTALEIFNARGTRFSKLPLRKPFDQSHRPTHINRTNLGIPHTALSAEDPGSLQGAHRDADYTVPSVKKESNSITKFLWSTSLSREESWLYYQACY